MTTTKALPQLYVHESGTRAAPAVVFLYADGASGGMWDQHMGRLADYHCLAPVCPGTAGATTCPGPPWTTPHSRWLG